MRLIFLLATCLCPIAVQAHTICLDPGHPSENGVGSRGRKLTELAANWSVAKRLAEILKSDGYEVIMTKVREDELVTNRRRAEIANEAKADLMVRLHCDAATGSGVAVYYPQLPGKAHGVEGPSKEVRTRSGEFARKFHPVLAAALKGIHPDRGLRTDRKTAIGARQGALTGSVHSKVPVLLVEMAVLTNPKDEAFLSSKKGHEAMAQALAKAVRAALPRSKT